MLIEARDCFAVSIKLCSFAVCILINAIHYPRLKSKTRNIIKIGFNNNKTGYFCIINNTKNIY